MDGGVGSPIAAKAAGVTLRQATYWASTGLVVPSIADTTGRGVHRRYSLRDVMALRAVGELRAQGVSLQKCRRVQQRLHEAGETLTTKRLMVFGDDVVLVHSDSDGMSLLEQHGQSVIVEAILSLRELEQTTRRELRRVAHEQRQRGPRPKRKKSRAA